MANFGDFLKTWSLGQTVLPDRSILKWQNLVENAKIQEIKYDILADFETILARFGCLDLMRQFRIF